MRFTLWFFWALLVVLTCLCCFLLVIATFAGDGFWAVLFALATVLCLWWCSLASDAIDDMEGAA